jgi:hypothetical protein
MKHEQEFKKKIGIVGHGKMIYEAIIFQKNQELIK